MSDKTLEQLIEDENEDLQIVSDDMLDIVTGYCSAEMRVWK